MDKDNQQSLLRGGSRRKPGEGTIQKGMMRTNLLVFSFKTTSSSLPLIQALWIINFIERKK